MSEFFATVQNEDYTKNFHINDVEDGVFSLNLNSDINNDSCQWQAYNNFEYPKTNKNGGGYYSAQEKQKQSVQNQKKSNDNENQTEGILISYDQSDSSEQNKHKHGFLASKNQHNNSDEFFGSGRPFNTESYEDEFKASLSSSPTEIKEKYTDLEGCALAPRRSLTGNNSKNLHKQYTSKWINNNESMASETKSRKKDVSALPNSDNYEKVPTQHNKFRNGQSIMGVNAHVERPRAFEQTRRTTDRQSTNVLARPSYCMQYGSNSENLSNNQSLLGNSLKKRPFKKKEKYMPVEKSDMELYDPTTQIQCGSRFEEMFSTENDEAVHVTGAGLNPPRVQSFKECEYSNEVMKNLEIMNYQSPTQIQKFVMPLILYMKGDVVGHASTGSGKTVAFLVPVIQKIQTLKHKLKMETARTPPYEPYAFIIAPTRELCQQLYDDARRLSMKTGVTIHLSMGDMPMSGCLASLRDGCDIFVATIGRTGHYILENYISLRKVLFFIMDEVDALVCKDKERKDQFNVFHNILKQSDLNPKHRTLLFSATLSSETQNKLKEFIRENTYFVYVGEVNRVVETVQQEFYKVEKARKRDYLQELLIRNSEKETLPNGDCTYKPPKTIVFVNEKRLSDCIAYRLALHGFQVISLNADRTLKQRIMAIEKFAKGIYDVLVATDVSSRGMNFPEVDHVINYDLPKYSQLTYVHRLGRSGRIGNEGRATSFFDEDVDKEFADYYIMELKLANKAVPEFLIEARDAYEKTEHRFNRDRQLNRRELSDRAWM